MKNTEQKIPALRFPDFSGEWEEKRLGEIANRVTKKNVDKEVSIVLSNSAVNGIVKQEDYFDFSVANEINNDRYYVVKKNDFVYNPRISVSAPVGPLKRSHFEEEGIISPLYTVLRFKDGCLDFYEIYFNSTHWHTYMKKVANYGVRFDRMNVTNEDLLNLPLPFPSLPEQQRIADFLLAVDKRLQLLKDKKTKLEEYKRGVMQRIFSQELRFTRPDGSTYPDWEEKRLGEISEKKSSNLSQNELEFNSGSFKVYGASGFLKQIDFYLEENPYIGIVKDGAGVGRLFLCDKQSSVLGTLDVIVNKKNTDIVFLYYILNLINFEKYSIGSTIPHIYFKDYSKEKLHIPCLDEQRPIADFLSAIDDKISLLNQQIQSTEQYKKGLLQQMFV